MPWIFSQIAASSWPQCFLASVAPAAHAAHLQQAPRTGNANSRAERTSHMDFKIELIAIPVSDVDRAKAFYADQAGFIAEHDHQVDENLRFVQLTPPGSACSITIGTGITEAEPGSVRGITMVVQDAAAARAELAARGVPVSDVQEFPWGSFVFFDDPDGNAWALQQLPVRT
jgi:predicted enzyme related to lactoylglutathione lyase